MKSKEDLWFKDILEKSAQELNNPDFEDRVMKRIEVERFAGIRISRNKQISWILFALGTLFGLSLPYLIPWNDTLFMSLDISQIKMAVNVIMTVGILIVFGVILSGSMRKNKIHL